MHQSLRKESDEKRRERESIGFFVLQNRFFFIYLTLLNFIVIQRKIQKLPNHCEEQLRVEAVT